jgi:hypothetical protein
MTAIEKELKDKILDSITADKERFFEADGKTYMRYDRIEVSVENGELSVAFYYKDDLLYSNEAPATGVSRLDELGKVYLGGLYGGIEIKLD